MSPRAFRAVVDRTVRTDACGRGFDAALPAFADELAATAGLLMPRDAGLPLMIVRGLNWTEDKYVTARDMSRPVLQELFI